MKLYIVATPIGNFQDITDRGRAVLDSVDLIAAEDTRHTGLLLAHLGVTTPMMAYHDFSDQRASSKIIARLEEGQKVALVSDAGTPLISDPGYRLVQDVLDAGFEIVPVPGASALLAALMVAGLPTDRFLFEGFLPSKRGARKARLARVAREPATLIWYESPRRVEATVADIKDILGAQRPVVLARELTKTYEQVARGTAAEMLATLQNGDVTAKGEFVVMAGGYSGEEPDFAAETLLAALLTELSPSRAAAVAAQLLGQSRKTLYQLALNLKDDKKD